MTFKDRRNAGQLLAERLLKYANADDVTVLGIPRGGVPVAHEVAAALHAPLDIFLSRKLGVPGQEELAFGAVATGDGRLLDREIIHAAGISAAQIERITETTRALLEERARLYRGERPPLSVAGRTVILIDDGVATGASMYAAIQAVRQMNPKKLVVAAPVAPNSTYNWLRTEADELVIPRVPEYFYAVGQFYEHFSQTTDEEVIMLLHSAEQFHTTKAARPDGSASESVSVPFQQDVLIPAGHVTLQGTLTLPVRARGVVLFVHGSGSSRRSARNLYVAEVLQKNGLGTLLFDLLTAEEEAVDHRTAELRFNIPLLTERLLGATEWVRRNERAGSLSIGYFGASTGAAAALVAAARLPQVIGAVVSRGGRPDLAGESPRFVCAPTLLIVGSRDEIVITLNRQAMAVLKCQTKQLILVPGATHLFEEAGALEEVARVASDWLVHYLASASAGEVNAVGTEATHK